MFSNGSVVWKPSNFSGLRIDCHPTWRIDQRIRESVSVFIKTIRIIEVVDVFGRLDDGRRDKDRRVVSRGDDNGERNIDDAIVSV